MPTEDHPSRKTWLLQIVVLAAVNALVGRLGQMLGIPPAHVTAVWPASGIGLAAILRFGPRVWPGIWIGSFLVNMATLFPSRPSLAAVLTASCMALGGVDRGARGRRGAGALWGQT